MTVPSLYYHKNIFVSFDILKFPDNIVYLFIIQKTCLWKGVTKLNQIK